MSAENLVALDLETECAVQTCPGLGGHTKCDHALSPWHSRITVVGIYGETIRKVFRDLGDLRSWLAANGSLRFIGHNFKFDLIHLLARDVVIPLESWVGDTQLAAYVLTDKIPDGWLVEYELARKKQTGKHRQAGKHSLKTLAPFHLGVDPFWETDNKDNDEYVLRDAEYTYRLFPVLQSKLQQLSQHDFYSDKQLPWTKLLLRAELRGIQLDLEAMDQMEKEMLEKRDRLKQELDEQWHDGHVAYTEKQIHDLSESYAEMGTKALMKTQMTSEDIQRVNARYHMLFMNARAKVQAGVDYNSPAQMLWLLRDYLGYDCSLLEEKVSEKTGKVTTDGTGAEVLERLANEGKDDVKKFLEYREVNKILTSYFPTYKSLQSEGTLHPIYNPDATVTGRTSSERINLQQVPPSLRRLFSARDGYTFVGYDAAAIEARIICLYTSDHNLYDVVRSGTSIHDKNTHIFFGLGPDVPLSAIKKDYAAQRATTKNVGFALFYNAGARRIRVTFTQGGFPIGEYESKTILKNFRETYAEAHRVANEYVQLFEAGEVIPNILGRPVKIQDASDAYMKGFNRLVQSSASDLNLEAALRTQKEYDANKMDAHVIGFVHDFVLVEAADNIKDEAEKILVKHMTSFNLECDLGPIKLEVEGGQMKRWEK
jgi:DNA polymerase I-like protein with 3'-5' exonuclease and polymerase domains